MAGMFRPHNSNAGIPDEAVKENARPKPMRANSKRQVLGNMTNQLRIQPQRLAKGKHLGNAQQATRISVGQENQAPLAAKGKTAFAFSSFTIFEDTAAAPVPVVAPVQESYDDEHMMDSENLAPCLALNEAPESFHFVAQYSGHPLEFHQPSTSAIVASPMFVDETFRSMDEDSLFSRDEFGLSPYFQDIYGYMRTQEHLIKLPYIHQCTIWPNKDYMARQTDVTTSMRNILVDWLIEVGEEYKLQRETVFLAVNYVDRFLSVVGVFRPKLQLVGAASMYLAAKYEEIYPPDVAEFVYITDDSYTKQQVVRMETVILKMLEFKVAVPTVNWFCERFMELLDMTDKTKSLSFLLIELSLVEIEEFLSYRPSVIAASALALARNVLGTHDPWPSHIEGVTGYSLAELKPCIRLLFSLYTQKDVTPHRAVIDKYNQSKYAKVSLITPPRNLEIL